MILRPEIEIPPEIFGLKHTKNCVFKFWPGEKRLGRIRLVMSYRENVAMPHVKTIQKYSHVRREK